MVEAAALAFQTSIVERAVQAREKDLQHAAKRRRVVDEDEYVRMLDAIIQRDFFPDLPRLRAQHELLEALEAGDTERARRAYAMAATPATGSKAPASTRAQWTPASASGWEATPAQPADAELPARGKRSCGTQGGAISVSAAASADGNNAMPAAGLDQYLGKNTSEDNASFAVLLKKMQDEHKRKLWWAQDPEQGGPPLRALPAPPGAPAIEGRTELLLLTAHDETSRAVRSAGAPARATSMQGAEDSTTEEGALVAAAPAAVGPTRDIAPADEPHRPWHKQGCLVRDDRPARLEMHGFSHRNSLYFVPDGHESQHKFVGKTPSLTSQNTRFPGSGTEPLLGSGAPAEASKQGPAEADHLRGYSLVATPSPALAPGESPMITWGEVVGTPMRLEDEVGDNVAQPFKVPTLPPRDQRLHRLAADAAKRLRQRTPTSASPRGCGSAVLGTQPRARGAAASPLSAPSPQLSAAGKRLAKSLAGNLTPGGGGLDTELRASYCPSLTPKRTPGGTPKVSHSKATPRLASTPASVTSRGTPQRVSGNGVGGSGAASAHRAVANKPVRHAHSRNRSSITDGLLSL